MRRLPRKFFKRPTLEVAQDLLGKYLVRNYRGKKIMAQIIETEAYIGENDLASHASSGRTPRNEIMYKAGGVTYIYLIYGMYYMLNFVTEKKEFPAAVLIRAIKIDDELIKGPGKLSNCMKVDKGLNNEDLVASKKIWIEYSKLKINKNNIKRFPRVGIYYAGSWRKKPWRFILNLN